MESIPTNCPCGGSLTITQESTYSFSLDGRLINKDDHYVWPACAACEGWDHGQIPEGVTQTQADDIVDRAFTGEWGMKK